MNITEQKRKLRADMRATRRGFVRALPASVRNLVFLTPPQPVRDVFGQSTCVGFYAAEEFEAPTQRYIEYAHDNGIDIALPYFGEAKGDMEFRVYAPDDRLECGPMKILQPRGDARRVTPDTLVLPLLAFDAGLRRLGQGGGHYDRYLAAHPDTRTIGLGWTVQQIAHIPVEPHDCALGMIVTQASIIETTATASKGPA